MRSSGVARMPLILAATATQFVIDGWREAMS